MGVRMGPSTTSASSQPDAATARPWLRRIDLIILPIVFVFDLLVFSRVLRADILTPTARIGIVVFSAVGVALLIFRRRVPVLVFGAVLLHSVAALLLTDVYFPMLITLVALEAVAELRSLRISLVALAATLVPITLMVMDAVRAASPQAVYTAAIGSTLFYVASAALAWGIGRWARRHRRQVDSLQAQHFLRVQEQEAETENAVLAERLRIAGELHDIVAHSVTIMVLHAAGAKRVVDTDPARAKESMTTIEESGRQAMGELRRLLELLKDDEGRSITSGSPLPGLAQLDSTLQSVRGSGVAVTLEVHGEPRRLDASTDLAAYRLIQEGLTNVTKHCGAGSRATVCLEWSDEKLTVAVEDDGAGAARLASALSTGNGLAGLRERVAVAGGDFVAGPTESGGYRVAARLPVSSMLQASALTHRTALPDQSDPSAEPVVAAAQPAAPVAPPDKAAGSAQGVRPEDAPDLARSDP